MAVAEFSPSDWKKIELFLKSNASAADIARAMSCEIGMFKKRVEKHYDGMPYTQVQDWFAKSGDALLLAKQFQLAIQGNVKLLIWLGKVRLGQKECGDTSSTSPEQEDIDKDHEIMQLKNELKKLKKKNAD